MSPQPIGTTTLAGAVALRRPQGRGVYSIENNLFGLDGDPSVGPNLHISRGQDVLMGAKLGSVDTLSTFWVPDNLAPHPYYAAAEYLIRGPGGKGLVAYRPSSVYVDAKTGRFVQDIGFILDSTGRKTVDLVRDPRTSSFYFADFTQALIVTDTDIRLCGAEDFTIFDFTGKVLSQVSRYPDNVWDGLAEWFYPWFMGWNKNDGRVYYQEQRVWILSGGAPIDQSNTSFLVWPPINHVVEDIMSSTVDRTDVTSVTRILEMIVRTGNIVRYGRPLAAAAHIWASAGWVMADNGTMYGLIEMEWGRSPLYSAYGSSNRYTITEWWLYEATPSGSVSMVRKLGESPQVPSAGLQNGAWDDFNRQDSAAIGLSTFSGSWQHPPGSYDHVQISSRAATPPPSYSTHAVELIAGTWDGEGWFTVNPNDQPLIHPCDTWYIFRSNPDFTRWLGMRVFYSHVPGYAGGQQLFRMTASGLQNLLWWNWDTGFGRRHWGVFASGNKVNISLDSGQTGSVDVDLGDTSDLGTYVGIAFNLVYDAPYGESIPDTTTRVEGFGWSPAFDRQALGENQGDLSSRTGCAGPEGDDVLFLVSETLSPIFKADVFQVRPGGSISKVIDGYGYNMPPNSRTSQVNTPAGPIVYADFASTLTGREAINRAVYEPPRGA